MDLKTISDVTVFSHRPQAGISIGVFVRDGVAHLAATFQNPLDRNFNRGSARSEILKRLAASAYGNAETTSKTRFIASRSVDSINGIAHSVPVNNLRYAKDVVAKIRDSFKPDPDEVDTTFTVSEVFGGIELRGPMSRDASWEKIVAIFAAL